jgi:hypothetical protein
MNDLKGTGGRPDTGTSALAVLTTPTTPTTIPSVGTVTTPTTQPTRIVVLREPVDRRVVRIVRGGRVSLVSMTRQSETPGPEMPSDENVAENGLKKPSHDAVGSIDPFDSK